MNRTLCVVLLALSVTGCSQPDASNLPAAEGALTSADFNQTGAPTVEFSVPDMMCPDSCAVVTREILSAQPGAKEVVVEFDSKTARVAIDEGTFDPEAALAALADRGFVHTELLPPGQDETAPAADQAKL